MNEFGPGRYGGVGGVSLIFDGQNFPELHFSPQNPPKAPKAVTSPHCAPIHNHTEVLLALVFPLSVVPNSLPIFLNCHHFVDERDLAIGFY